MMIPFKEFIENDTKNEGVMNTLKSLALAGAVAGSAAAAPNSFNVPFKSDKPILTQQQQARAYPLPTKKELFHTLKKHEGFERKAYPDVTGMSIGIGFHLSDPSNKAILNRLHITNKDIKNGLNDFQIENLFYARLEVAVKDAKSFIGANTFITLPTQVQAALINMSYNLGINRLNKFVDLKAALIKYDFKEAALEMKDSLWAQQTGNRATELANIVRNAKL